jgi:predicted aspartyl protease
MGLAWAANADPPTALPNIPAAPQNIPVAPEGNPVDPDDDVLFASPTTVDHIGRIVVGVMVDDRGPFRFIVDTGANYSTVSPALATKLGLQPAADQTIQVNGITGTAAVPSVLIDKLQAGSLEIDNTRFPVVWAPVMAGADGILGVAGLTHERLHVDFEHNRVQITRATHAAELRSYSRLGAVRIHGGLLSVPGEVGGVRVQAIIDTGSARTIANRALRNALLARQRPGKHDVLTTKVYGATTDVATGELDISPLIDLGAIRVASVTLVFGDFHIFDVWDLTKRPAIIVGMDILGTVAGLSVDFQDGQIYIDSKLHLQSVAQTDMPGVRLRSLP